MVDAHIHSTYDALTGVGCGVELGMVHMVPAPAGLPLQLTVILSEYRQAYSSDTAGERTVRSWALQLTLSWAARSWPGNSVEQPPP